MSIRKILRMIIITCNVLFLFKYEIYNEPIFIFILYVIFNKNKYFILFLSCTMFLKFNITYFFKNIIFFIMFEIFLIILTDHKINTKGKYRIFLLTFFIYLVLINVFEPIVYNYKRLYESIWLYILNLFIYKIFIKTNLFVKGSDYIEWSN